MLREIQEGKDAASASRLQASPIGLEGNNKSPQKQDAPGQEETSKRQQEQDALMQQLDLSQATVQELLEEELPNLRKQLDYSQAIIQDLLEREFPKLTTQVVAVTLRDYDFDVADTREVLKSLSGI